MARFNALIFTLLFVFICPPSSFAASAESLEAAFEQLRDSGENYVTQGTVCEQVARLKLEEIYPAESFHVDTGIVYADQQRVIGELDVVVFRRADEKVMLIAEVKCWQDLRDAIKKARQQRARFQRTMATGRALKFYSKTFRYPRLETADAAKFISVSQAGGERAGFEMTLGFTLDELMTLRQQLLTCQSEGRCKKPW